MVGRYGSPVVTSPKPAPPELELRTATTDDDDAIVALASSALGWQQDEPNLELFRWKHRDNAFGASPMWVAVDHQNNTPQLVGFRAMMQWRFRSVADGSEVRAVRAVDTATAPSHQGQGIFRRLTTAAVDQLTAEGFDFVFNTPNTQSRPGYLKMGWSDVGRPTIHARLTGVRAALALRGARTAADKWSLPSDAGVDAREAFADVEAISALLEATRTIGDRGLRTDHRPETLAWRYGLAELRYRAVLLTSSPADGLAVFRVRTRGSATEATIAEVLIPEPGALGPLLRKVRQAVDADYLLASDSRLLRHGYLPVPRQGPALTTRSLASPGPELDAFDFRLGDLELF